VLDDSPLAGEAFSEQLTPTEQSLFLAEASGSIVVLRVVVKNPGWPAENFVLEESGKQSALESWASVFGFVEFLELVEKCANQG
jgi:hypothetical protein